MENNSKNFLLIYFYLEKIEERTVGKWEKREAEKQRSEMRRYTHTYIQSILIICGFCIYEFAYLLKFICDPKINILGTFVIILKHIHKKSSENFELLDTHS